MVALILVYYACGHYDKMGVRSDMDTMLYYMETGEQFILQDDYVIDVNDSEKRYPREEAFIDVLGYLVIIENENLSLVDAENHIYKDDEGHKYIKLEYTYWDFFGYPVLR